MEMIRFIFAAIFLISGVATMMVAVFGLFHFKFVLNRMHTAATSSEYHLRLLPLPESLTKGIIGVRTSPTTLIDMSFLNESARTITTE